MSSFEMQYQTLKVKKYTLRGFLTVPQNRQFNNIVVMLHGYTGHKNENGFLFKQLSESLINLNLASLRFDFMGSGDSDGHFQDFTFLTECNDALGIIDYAYKLNNNKPIILLGFSMGGAVATQVSLQKQEKIQKMILISCAGCMDQKAQFTFSNNKVDENGNVDLGGYYLNKRFLDSFKGIDLYKDLQTFTKPVLIIHGTADQSVPVEYGIKYSKIYPHNECHIVDGAPHCFSKIEYRDILQKYILNYLKGEE